MKSHLSTMKINTGGPLTLLNVRGGPYGPPSRCLVPRRSWTLHPPFQPCGRDKEMRNILLTDLLFLIY